MANCVTITLLLWASLAAPAHPVPMMDASSFTLAQSQQSVFSSKDISLRQWGVIARPVKAADWLLLDLFAELSYKVIPAAVRTSWTSVPLERGIVKALCCICLDPIRGP